MQATRIEARLGMEWRVWQFYPILCLNWHLIGQEGGFSVALRNVPLRMDIPHTVTFFGPEANFPFFPNPPQPSRFLSYERKSLSNFQNVLDSRRIIARVFHLGLGVVWTFLPVNGSCPLPWVGLAWGKMQRALGVSA